MGKLNTFLKFFYYILSFGIHVQNTQVCYIGIYVPWWFAAPINLSSTLGISPNAILPLAHLSTDSLLFQSCISLFSSLLTFKTMNFGMKKTLVLNPSSTMVSLDKSPSPFEA